jgi:hypothetical protein
MKFRHNIVPDFHIASNEACRDTLDTGIPATEKNGARSAKGRAIKDSITS